jgi:hypothetical protein
MQPITRPPNVSCRSGGREALRSLVHPAAKHWESCEAGSPGVVLAPPIGAAYVSTLKPAALLTSQFTDVVVEVTSNWVTGLFGEPPS